MNEDAQKSMLAAAGRYIRKMMVPVEARLKSLESITVEKGDPGKDGSDGKDGRNGIDGQAPSVDDIATIFEARFADLLTTCELQMYGMIEKAVDSIQAPKDGRDGADAEPVDVDALADSVAGRFERRFDELSVSWERKSLDMAEKAVAAIPTPKDGKDGADAESVSTDAVADVVATKFERRFADLSISWERQSRDMAEKAIDRMPHAKDGESGKDGRDFGAFEFEYDGARALTIRYEKDGETVEQVHRMPVVIDAGFFKEGESYEKGDGTTFGGSYWIAQADTSSKPEIGSTDWRLAVKKGRDAKSVTRRSDNA